MKPIALITGVMGQDGAYLSRLLLEKGYRVIGADQHVSDFHCASLRTLGIDLDIDKIRLDITDPDQIRTALTQYRPDEIYNLAALSSVAESWNHPVAYAHVNAIAVNRFLEDIRAFAPETRFFQASSSEMFGNARMTPQREDTALHPLSPYAVSKASAHWTTVNYRESFDLHCSSGIMFNHESPLRPVQFVTRKVVHSLVQVAYGACGAFTLGNLDARRDWGYAGDYADAMWRILQQPQGDDFVIATGRTHTVRQLCSLAGSLLGFDIVWEGEDETEIGIDRKTGKTLVRVDPALYRPLDSLSLCGDPAKAYEVLGWRAKTSFELLIETMVAEDCDRLSAQNFTRVAAG